MRRFVKIAAAVLVIAVCGFAAFQFLGKAMTRDIQAAFADVGPLKLEEVADGVYRGAAGEFICSVNLEVTVKDHRIVDIRIIKQFAGPDHKALETVTRILDGQTAKVDAVAGATWSSETIMAATYRALHGK